MTRKVPAAWPLLQDQPYRIAFVAEAPADEDTLSGRPLSGSEGRELDGWLRMAGIARGACLVTQVFDEQPPDGDVTAWCVDAKTFKALTKERGLKPDPILAHYIERGFYLHPDHWHHLDRLRAELERHRPNLIVPLGNTALWAVTGQSGIDARRGAVTPAAIVPALKVLPTYAPADVWQKYNTRYVAIADLMRARHEGGFPDIRLRLRRLWLEPTLEDLDTFHAAHLAEATLISCDIETARDQIECISFAPDPTIGLIVPFVDWRKPNKSYWPTPEEELLAWEWCERVLTNPIPKLFQNGASYDLMWLAERGGIEVRNYCEDTRLQHHALYPELKKDLGFLGSLYESEGAWKLLRSQKAAKRDE